MSKRTVPIAEHGPSPCPADSDFAVPGADTAGVRSEPPAVERRVSDAERRNTTLRSLLQGSMTPRRRTGRRASDHQAVVDWHDPHLMFLSVAMLMLSVADAFLTVSLLAVGAIETNPLLAAVLQERPELFAVTKLALTGFSVIVLVAVARRRLLRFIPVQSVFQFLVLAYLALVIYELWLIWSLR